MNGLILPMNAVNGGIPGYFRLIDANGNCHMRGTASQTTGDMLIYFGTILPGAGGFIVGFLLIAPGA